MVNHGRCITQDMQLPNPQQWRQCWSMRGAADSIQCRLQAGSRGRRRRGVSPRIWRDQKAPRNTRICTVVGLMELEQPLAPNGGYFVGHQPAVDHGAWTAALVRSHSTQQFSRVRPARRLGSAAMRTLTHRGRRTRPVRIERRFWRECSVAFASQ